VDSGFSGLPESNQRHVDIFLTTTVNRSTN